MQGGTRVGVGCNVQIAVDTGRKLIAKQQVQCPGQRSGAADRDGLCLPCPLKARCANADFRVVNRFENEAVLDRMAHRLAARPDVLDQRRESVEHPFGSIKQWMGQGAFLMRRIENVRVEFSLTALTYNLRRAITILGIPALTAAVRT